MSIPENPTDPTPIPSWPEPVPQRTLAPNVFRPAADAWMAAFPDQSASFTLIANQTNDNAVYVKDRAEFAGTQASTALSASDAAQATANFKGRWVDLSGALAIPASVEHQGVIWALLNDVADVTLSEPAFDNPDWATLTGFYVEDRTTNVSLRSQDVGKILYLNGDFTQTIEDIALLPVGWFTYLRNVGSSVITVDPFEAQTVDGAATLALNPGQTIMLIRDETEFRSIRFGGALQEEYTTSQTINRPPSAAWVYVELWAGGQGGANRTDSPSSPRTKGGTGGEYVAGWISSEDFGESQVLTIGTGGVGGASGVIESGASGGDTSLGSLIVAKGAISSAGTALDLPRQLTPSNIQETKDAVTSITGWHFGAGSTSGGLNGGSCVHGGAGGGCAAGTNATNGGTSERGGDGGDASVASGVKGGDGQFPSGAGGASTNDGGGGDGADGMARLTWF